MIQSRSPPGQPRRPSTHEGMAEMKQGPQQSPQQQQQHGHIMQSRTTSTSHGVRSRSNGRRGRRYTQLHDDASASSSNYEQFRQQKQMRKRSSLSDQYASHDFNNSASLCQMVNEDLMDENGRCIRHAGIELCRRENDLWRVLLQDCPLCSMDVGGNGHGGRAAASNGGAAANAHTKNNAGGNVTSGRTKKGAESSLQTATTSPLSEEEECKSWTLSDASTSDDDGGRSTKGARGKHQSQQQQDQQQQQEQQPPPPPRKKTDKYNDSSSKSSNEKKEKKKKSSKRDKTRNASRSKRSGRNNQVASLKELGRKLAMENSASATTTTAAAGTGAGAGAGAGMNNPDDEVSMGADSINPIHVAKNTSSQNAQHTHQQQQQQQHHPPPPPRRLTSGGSDLRSLSTKELSELRRVRKAAAAAAAAAATIASIEGTRQHTQGKVMDEASELISRMTKISSSDANTETRKRNSRKKSATAAAANNIGSPHVAASTIRDETEAILGAAAEARARVLSRRNKLLGNSSQDLGISYNDDAVRINAHVLGGNRRGGSEGNVTEEEMKTDDGGRGRGRGDDDILGAAAEIRLRARRSLSRSRERVKAASMFCGETPTDYGDEDEEENDGNETVATTQSKRSILNPHGLSVQPQAPSVERRSQSRGKERHPADDWNEDDRHNHFEGTSHSHATERRPRSRNRRDSQVSGLENNNVSSAEALINRRREMRQRIAERQSNVVKRHGRSFNELDQSEKAGVDHLADAMLNEWNSVTDEKVRRSSKEARDADKGRRGRSRSVVRDGLSKIRSASLSAFRKSITSSHGAREEDNGTVDTGRRSTQSSTSILSRLKKKKQVRSLSRSRSVASEFDARSDSKSDSFALQPGGAFASSEDEVKSSAGSILQRFSLSKSKNDQVRSLSRGSFRDSGANSEIHASNGADAWMTEESARSSLMSRLSKTKQSKGTVRSLSRNGSIDGEMGHNDIHETTKSESFAMNHGTAWAFEDNDEMHLSNRFSKRSPGRRNPFD
ncbi:hypothetical protein HJC23_000456 [Cyclotella cryptica]|uniref:Uncharacterized protein n=1 Tax=Cyclotella cryptica TaxID=29204 RepID=A0ABD3Q9Y3_9STRA|eukprot:CCRYP_007199-RA/>CCRYP_007199-RA protein AED:0.00 eAED:0.00 QI:279/1/1/1/1/1/2/251/1012